MNRLFTQFIEQSEENLSAKPSCRSLQNFSQSAERLLIDILLPSNLQD